MAWLKGNKVDCLIISDNILCLIKKFPPQQQSPNIQVEKLTLICGNGVVRGWQGVRTIE